MIPKKLYIPIAAVAAILLAVLIAFAPGSFSVLYFVLALVPFGLGAMAMKLTQEPPARLEEFLDSDWRHFEMLVELSAEQIAKLQSLTRRAHQKAEALAWLERQWSLREGQSEEILYFFVASGWALNGHKDHANDPEWAWQIRRGGTS